MIINTTYKGKETQVSPNNSTIKEKSERGTETEIAIKWRLGITTWKDKEGKIEGERESEVRLRT